MTEVAYPLSNEEIEALCALSRAFVEATTGWELTLAPPCRGEVRKFAVANFG